MTERTLRIAFLCDMPPSNRNMYSGGNARIYDALCKHVGDVTVLSQSWHLAEPIRRLIHATPEAVNIRLRWRAHLALSRIISRGVAAELRQGRYDVLFGTYALHAMRHVRPPYPMVTAFTSDATQTVYRESEIGEAFDRKLGAIGGALDNWIERCERETLQATDVLLWPSNWLKSAAAERYGLESAKGHLVPWGANIDTPPAVTERVISRSQPVNLLLIGRDWFAKGGPVTFETMMALRAQGHDARLTVIGCEPPDFHRNEWVTVHGLLNKAVPHDLKTFEGALADAHFLVQPSFESYGFAFCEASAFGLPSLCLDIGGVPVWEGWNGLALPKHATADDFRDTIAGYINDPQAYYALGLKARETYDGWLNWDAWGKKTSELLQEAVQKRS